MNEQFKNDRKSQNRLWIIKPIYLYHKILVGIGLAVVSVYSLFVSREALREAKEANKIAMQSYKDAQAGGAEQLKALEQSRKALETVSTNVHENYELYKTEVEALRRERNLKPFIEIDLNEIKEEKYSGKAIILKKESDETLLLRIAVRNTGDISWKTPLLMVQAPDSIRIWEKGLQWQTDTPNKVQIRFDLPAIPPVAKFGAPIESMIKIAPGHYSKFDLVIRLFGDGAPTKMVRQWFVIQ